MNIEDNGVALYPMRVAGEKLGNVFPELMITPTLIRIVGDDLEQIEKTRLASCPKWPWDRVVLLAAAHHADAWSQKPARVGLRHLLQHRLPEQLADLARRIAADEIGVDPAKAKPYAVASLRRDDRKPSAGRTPQVQRGSISQAVALRVEGHTVPSIVSTTGIPRSTLYANSTFRQACKARKSICKDLPKGSKDRDGNLEAEAL